MRSGALGSGFTSGPPNTNGASNAGYSLASKRDTRYNPGRFLVVAAAYGADSRFAGSSSGEFLHEASGLSVLCRTSGHGTIPLEALPTAAWDAQRGLRVPARCVRAPGDVDCLREPGLGIRRSRAGLGEDGSRADAAEDAADRQGGAAARRDDLHRGLGRPGCGARARGDEDPAAAGPRPGQALRVCGQGHQGALHACVEHRPLRARVPGEGFGDAGLQSAFGRGSVQRREVPHRRPARAGPRRHHRHGV